jgi:hypothetical protein
MGLNLTPRRTSGRFVADDLSRLVQSKWYAVAKAATVGLATDNQEVHGRVERDPLKLVPGGGIEPP